MTQHPVDQYFKERLESLEVTPGTAVWERIEGKLEDKRKPMGFWLSIAAALVLLISVLSFFFYNQGGQHVEPQISDQPAPAEDVFEQRPKSIQPAGTMPGTDKSVPIMAQKDQREVVNEHTSLHKGRMAFADFEGDESELGEQTIWPIDPIRYEQSEKKEKKRFGIALANTEKYIEKEEPRYGEKLRDYSVAQWDNIKHGNKLESPPGPDINFPKIRFERTQN